MNDSPTVLVLDDDADIGAAVARLVARHGYRAEAFCDPALFLTSYVAGRASCIVSDIMLGSHNGFDIAEEVRRRDSAVAFIFITAWPTVDSALTAVRKHRGFEYLDKPLDPERLMSAVHAAVAWSARKRQALRRLDDLTRRERQVFELLVRGLTNKAVAAELNVSPKTVEDHRAALMAKTQADSLADLIAIARAVAE